MQCVSFSPTSLASFYPLRHACQVNCWWWVHGCVPLCWPCDGTGTCPTCFSVSWETLQPPQNPERCWKLRNEWLKSDNNTSVPFRSLHPLLMGSKLKAVVICNVVISRKVPKIQLMAQCCVFYMYNFFSTLHRYKIIDTQSNKFTIIEII